MIKHLPALIPILPLCSAMLCLIFGRINRNLGKYIVMAAIATSFVSSLILLGEVVEGGEIHYWMGNWQPPLGIEFVVDAVNAILLVAFSAVSLLACIYGQSFFKKEDWFEISGYYALYGLLTAGLLGMTITGDMFNLYVFLEIASLSGYGLIALGGDRSTIAAFRYLLLGTIAASFYLLAVAYLYAITGTLNMADMAVRLSGQLDSPNVILAIAMLIIAFGTKMALFPLHGWQPDAYTYSHPAAAPLISGVMSKVPALAVFRYMYCIIGADSFYVQRGLAVIGFIGALGIIYGSVMAIAQKDFRRMLAYSSVAQIGYIAVGFSIGNAHGVVAAVLHIITHAFMKSSLFMVTGGIRYRYGQVRIDKFGGLNKHMPFTAFTLTVAALSMVGIPPTGGFFSKWYLVLGAFESGKVFFAVVLIVSSLLNAIYFFKVLENVFARPDAKLEEVNETGRFELPLSMMIPIIIAGVTIIALGLCNTILVDRILINSISEVFFI
ncbi:MAG: monovalent cation/H+ antiporter subunit D family protein [Firmicutes bacterium]|nr:monovalent cation/H+ antiporter subunit D family protein [Bacillota bacterium]